MTDDTIETDKPIPFPDKQMAEQGRPLEQGPAEQAEPEPVDAKTRLRDFEDRVIGKEAARIDGKIERGHGSKFRGLSEAEKREHSSLEQVVEAEHKLATATHELSKAQAHHASVSAAADRHGRQ